VTGADHPVTRWWRYAVLRGDGIPTRLDGMWFDVDDMARPEAVLGARYEATVEATNRWEQRSDGAVAVVYEWVRRGVEYEQVGCLDIFGTLMRGHFGPCEAAGHEVVWRRVGDR
jgi:hypothetical protein